MVDLRPKSTVPQRIAPVLAVAISLAACGAKSQTPVPTAPLTPVEATVGGGGCAATSRTA
jgi:para-nitrobenzyl esterase